jgi:hypothetical protein
MSDALLWWAVGGCLITALVINLAALIGCLSRKRD